MRDDDDDDDDDARTLAGSARAEKWSPRAAVTPPPPPLALRAAMRARYATTFVERLDDGHARDARERPIEWLERECERVYDAKYENDARARRGTTREDGGAAGRRDANANANEEDETTTTFGDFAYGRWARTLGVKSLVEKHAWEVMCNAEAARKSKTSECAELFCAFVRRAYDDDALLFFLYCRRWLKYECALMARRGERVMRTDDLGRARAEKGRANHIDAGVHACDVSLDAKQATTVVRSIFYGVTSEGERRDASFLYATVCAMIEDAFSADATASWATRSDVDGADATKAVIRIDGYRLLKMLLSVFVDTTPPADAFVGKPIKTQSKASRREAATRDLSSAMETVEVRPKPKLPPAAVATAKPEPSPTPSAEATKEIALYHATLRAAVTDAVGKYAAALFPKEVPKQSIDEAQTKLDALAQDLLTKIIDDDAEIVDEAPMACKSYARAKESIRQGLGTPGAESPAVGASSTRDVARAILATPAIKRAVEPMLKLAVQSVKTMSATNRPVPVPRMDREPEPSL